MSQIIFLITDQPEFTVHPPSQAVREGKSVTLSCNASGNPEPTFSWTKDGITVNTNANPRITLSSQNKELTISNVDTTDSGQYRCIATNARGTVNSSVATLDVQCKCSVIPFLFFLLLMLFLLSFSFLSSFFFLLVVFLLVVLVVVVVVVVHHHRHHLLVVVVVVVVVVVRLLLQCLVLFVFLVFLLYLINVRVAKGWFSLTTESEQQSES